MFHSRGEEVATATTIMFSWDLATFIPLLGIEIAVTSLVGRYMGAQDPDTAHKAAMSGIKTGIYYSAIVLVLFVFIPETLANVFRPDTNTRIFDQALPIATKMIRIASLYVLAEAMMVALSRCASRGRGYPLDHDCFRYVSLDIHTLALGDVSRAECIGSDGMAGPCYFIPPVLRCLVSEVQKRKMEKNAGDRR